MKTNKLRINLIERKILKVLLLNGGILNTNEVAQMSRMSWNTVKSYLKKLCKKGWVKKKKIGTITYFYANY